MPPSVGGPLADLLIPFDPAPTLEKVRGTFQLYAAADPKIAAAQDLMDERVGSSPRPTRRPWLPSSGRPTGAGCAPASGPPAARLARTGTGCCGRFRWPWTPTCGPASSPTSPRRCASWRARTRRTPPSSRWRGPSSARRWPGRRNHQARAVLAGSCPPLPRPLLPRDAPPQPTYPRRRRLTPDLGSATSTTGERHGT